MKKILSSLLLCLTATTSILFAQSPLKTHTVSIFKDGTAFFVRSGEVPLLEKSFRIAEADMPKPLYGSFWFHAPGQSNYIIRRVQDTIRSTDIYNRLADLPKNNIGKRVRVQSNDTWYDGVILSADDQMLVLKHNDVWMPIQTDSVTLLQFFDEPQTTFESKKVQNSLLLDFPRAKSRQDLEMMYLQRGIAWFPSYILELDEEDKARITFRAEIVNDAEDLEEASINFVVGVPNFRYSQSGETPLVSDVSISQMMRMIGNSNSSGFDFNAITSNSQVVGYASDGPMGATFEPMPINQSAEGSSLEDLYFYRLDDITLPKGGRASYNILTAEIPVAHVYECQLPSNSASAGYYRSLSAEEKYSEVTHKLKLQNNTDQPFTTGAAFVSRIVDGTTNPISQDQLKYTPVGGETYLKITTAPDVRVSFQEEEAEVEENVKKEGKINYDLITVKGTVSVKNYKNKAIDLNVRRTITGNLDQSNPDWLQAIRVNLNRNLNATTDVCWELKLKAGEEQTVEYSYKIYVAN